jgi:hypothetical protein
MQQRLESEHFIRDEARQYYNRMLRAEGSIADCQKVLDRIGIPEHDEELGLDYSFYCRVVMLADIYEKQRGVVSGVS